MQSKLHRIDCFLNGWGHSTIAIDVWEGASGASADAPRFGLKINLVSSARKELVKTFEKMNILLYFTQLYLIIVIEVIFQRGKGKKQQLW